MRAKIWSLLVASVWISASLEGQDWNGLHGGIHVGYSSVKPEFTEPVFDPATVSPGVDGFIGGALLVYRGSRIGVEGEIGIAGLSATQASEGGGFTRFETEWVSRARLTLNHPMVNTLFFGAVGVTAMSFYVDDAFIDEVAEDPLVHDPSLTTLTGWTIGVGVERMWRERISARVEAIYDRYGGEDLSTSPGEGRIEPTATTIRVGMLFKF